MKQDINLAICGHAWHGKSTLVGKTVAELGMVSRRKLEQFEAMARQGRDPSFVFALMVFRQKDVTHKKDEAARGITVLPSFVRFDMEKHRVTVVDTPGQEDYTNNRFSGMFSADCAVLVVDVTGGVQPVTEQVLRILRGYEIPLVGVVVSKMDRARYSKEAYDEAVEIVRVALATYEIPDDIPFIPTSAYASGRPLTEPGEGITRVSEAMGWYEGPTFHDLLSSLDLKVIRPQRPLRLVIHSADIHEQVPGVGSAFTGLVEAGELKKDQTLRFEPASAEAGEPVTAEVRSLELTKGHIATPGIPLTVAHPRQLVGVALRHVEARGSLRTLCKGRGTIAGTEDEPPRVANRFEAEVTVFEPDVTVKIGQQFTLHAHVDKVAVTVLKIEPNEPQAPPGEEAASPGEEAAPSGEEAAPPAAAGGEPQGENEQAPEPEQHLKAGVWARVTFEALRPIALEEAARMPPLSKIVLRMSNRPIGLGRCTRILK